MALRFVPTGNIEAAGRLKGVGWRLLHDLKRRMSFQKLFQDRAVLKTEDGTIIECLVCGALDTINVFVPIPVIAAEKEKIAEVEALKYRIYCVLIEYDWWKDGDITGYISPKEAYKQVYLKIDKNEIVSELQEGEIQDFVLKTPLSEFKMRERLINNESADFLEPLGYSKDPSYCSLLRGHNSYLYTPSLPTAAWSYLLKMPDSKTLGIMGSSTGIVVWDEKDTVVEYKAVLQGSTWNQSEHTQVGYTKTFITVWYEGISEILSPGYSGIPYWERAGVWSSVPGSNWIDEGWSFKGRQYNTYDPDSFDYWDSSGLTESELDTLIVTRNETYTKPSVTFYSCVATYYEDHSPNIEDINEVSTLLNFEDNYRIFGQHWYNKVEGLILAKKDKDYTILIKLSEPENNYVRIEYSEGSISLEIIEDEMPELSGVTYNSISGIKEYNPILAGPYSCTTNDTAIINQYLGEANTPFLLLPKTGFTNYSITEEPLFLPAGGR